MRCSPNASNSLAVSPPAWSFRRLLVKTRKQPCTSSFCNVGGANVSYKYVAGSLPCVRPMPGGNSHMDAFRWLRNLQIWHANGRVRSPCGNSRTRISHISQLGIYLGRTRGLSGSSKLALAGWRSALSLDKLCLSPAAPVGLSTKKFLAPTVPVARLDWRLLCLAISWPVGQSESNNKALCRKAFMEQILTATKPGSI